MIPVSSSPWLGVTRLRFNLLSHTLSIKFSMDRSWLIDSRGLAKKVINAGYPDAYQIKDCKATTRCPSCNFLIDNSNAHEGPGLPAGVKFDPSDAELLLHLAAKRGVGESEPHAFIDDFIPTLDGEEGICYTHPENLPGVKKDGSSVHFFYRITNAYASGRRKRRRIQDQESTEKKNVRWHKTGKTKPVMENGIQKGFKKIMVLYGTSKEGSKPDKCNWVMHQYHLGTNEEENEGEYVVSKIFHQPDKETVKNGNPTLVVEECDAKAVPVIPMTPKTTTPDLPSQNNTPYSDCISDDVDYILQLLLQPEEEESDIKAVPVIPVTPKTTTPNPPSHDQPLFSDWLSVQSFLQPEEEESDIKAIPVIPVTPKTTTPNPPRHDQPLFSDWLSVQSFLQSEQVKEPFHAPYDSRLEDDQITASLDTNSKVVDLSLEDPLLCNEIMESSYAVLGDLGPNDPFSTQVNRDINCVHERDAYASNERINCSYAVLGDLGPNDLSSTQVNGDINAVYERDAYAIGGIGELENLELDTPPDFEDLQFPSQDSVFDIVERM